MTGDFTLIRMFFFSFCFVIMLPLLIFFFFIFCTLPVWLNGTRTANETEKFVGFMIYVHNEFEDEESGHFVTPLPQGVSMTECHMNARSYIVRFSRFGFSFYS